MIIKAKLYKDKITTDIISVVVTMDDGQVWAIPLDPDNTDYQAYLAWLEEGNEPEPADELTSE